MDKINFANQIPSYLNQELLDTAIRSYLSDQDAKITSFVIKPATKPGENFASAVFRVKIKFTSKSQKDVKEMSLIVKTLPVSVNVEHMEHMNDSTLFKCEINAYHVLEKIQDLISSVGYVDKMCPKLIYQVLTPMPVIVMEDVSAIGYDTLIKKLHDDFEVSKLIFRRLAKFHAASFYLNDEKIIDAAAFDTSIYKMEHIGKLFAESFEILLSFLNEWGGYDEYIEPIKKFSEFYFKKAQKTYEPNVGPGAFNVLNHCDHHPKNVIYKMKSDGVSVEDYMMLDFQTCCYASPAIDLTYAIYTFVSDENRLTRYDELLATYHAQFVEALNKFGYLKQPLTLLDLHIEMLKNGILEPIVFLILFPLVFIDISEINDEDSKDIMKAWRTIGYKSEIFKKNLKEYLIRFINKGFLN